MILPTQLEELRNKRVWLNYVLIYNERKHNGEGGYDKPPVNPYTLRDGSSTDSARWATFDECNAQIGKPATVFYKNKEYVTQPVAGVGLVLEAAGILGIDFDNVVKLDAEGRVVSVSDEARRIWRYVDSYTETSVSGTGVHILVYGKKPGSEVCKVSNPDGTDYEMYDSGRYFTISGYPMRGCKGIQRRDEQVLKVYDFILQRRREQAAARSSSVVSSDTGGSGALKAVTEDDRALLEKAYQSRAGDRIRRLYAGDTSDYKYDHSVADCALIADLGYWTNYDEERTDRLFRASGLYRDKWERADYRAMTFSRAWRGRTAYREYTPEEKKKYAQQKEKAERAASQYGDFLINRAKRKR